MQVIVETLENGITLIEVIPEPHLNIYQALSLVSRSESGFVCDRNAHLLLNNDPCLLEGQVRPYRFVLIPAAQIERIDYTKLMFTPQEVDLGADRTVKITLLFSREIIRLVSALILEDTAGWFDERLLFIQRGQRRNGLGQIRLLRFTVYGKNKTLATEPVHIDDPLTGIHRVGSLAFGLS